MTPDNSKIAELLVKHMAGTLNPEEQEYLSRWFGEDKNRKWFDDFVSRADYDQKFDQLRNIDWQAAYGDFRRKHRSFSYRKVLRYAAVLVIPVLAAAYFLLRDGQPQQPEQQRFTAVLERSSGQTIVLGKKSTSDNTLPANIELDNEANQLIYHDREADRSITNRVSVARGNEFKLRLPDGTMVHLNASTVLEFPEKFPEGQRTVKLSGEAWFEVAPDSENPFTVIADQMQVRVLGTRFNITTLEQGKIYTALEEGSVEIWSGSLSAPRIMKPGQLAAFDTATGTLDVADTDLRPYLGWKEGMFVFSAEPMGSIMEKLSRAYDMDITFADESLKDVRFSGHLQRYDDINIILKALERTTSVSFTHSDKGITVQ